MVALGLGSAMKRNAHERLSAWGGERTSKCHEAGCRARRDRRSKHNRNLKDSQNGRVLDVGKLGAWPAASHYATRCQKGSGMHPSRRQGKRAKWQSSASSHLQRLEAAWDLQ
jgi:hypothetical protein